MANKKTNEQYQKYESALKKAKKLGYHKFVCPLCGGVAFCSKSYADGRLNSGCEKCGFTIQGKASRK